MRLQINLAFWFGVVLAVAVLGLGLFIGRRLWRRTAHRARTELVSDLLAVLAAREAAGELTPEQAAPLRADLEQRMAEAEAMCVATL